MMARYSPENFGISPRLVDIAREVEVGLAGVFAKIDEVGESNQLKVLSAMQKHRLGEHHFLPTTGYGYNDMGREVSDAIFADVFGCEAALVRPTFVSGTHTLAAALFGNLRPGDELLASTGRPHITLEKVIGLQEHAGSLMDYGVTYKEVALLEGEDGVPSRPDFEGIRAAIRPQTRLVHIQRSRGYTWRNALSIADIKDIVRFVKDIRPDIICFVDNCYGEFTETLEPTDVGADIVVGSLIKNPGGGLAPVGGYVVGRREPVNAAATRLTAPGIGGDVGPSLGIVPTFMQGLFFAPSVVAAALKTAAFTAGIMERLGYDTMPRSNGPRSDIVQSIRMGTPEGVLKYCCGIQQAAAVDSHLKPEPWDMPGYDSDVIMAAGAFVQGSGIEFSADAPMKPPYIVYQQGALTWWHGKIGALIAINSIL